MPYGISDKQSGCSGWAAVKQESDGSLTTLECYPTKQEAIDRMVAQSLAEGMEPAGDLSDRQLPMMEEPEMPEEPESEDEEEEEEDNPESYKEMMEGLAEMVEKGLSPRQFFMYDLYEKIADEFGVWNQGIGADGAHYVAESPFAEQGMICSNCVFYEGGQRCEIVEGQIAPEGICKLWVISEKLLAPEETSERVEVRAVDLSAPAFMRSSARRGLALHEEGLSGDGLVAQTVEDARKMAAGQISEAKWRKIAPWIARHMGDLDAVQGDEITPGLVAMLLWGGGSSKASARRAQAYAERVVERLDADK